jgi:outer membrane murein-binding lipoprotein Lpp
MSISKYVRSAIAVGAFAITALIMSGCGGVSDAEMAQLNDLRSEVKSLQSQADSLKEERASLEKDIAAKNAKLQECAKDKEETKANLEKLPQ